MYDPLRNLLSSGQMSVILWKLCDDRFVLVAKTICFNCLRSAARSLSAQCSPPSRAFSHSLPARIRAVPRQSTHSIFNSSPLHPAQSWYSHPGNLTSTFSYNHTSSQRHNIAECYYGSGTKINQQPPRSVARAPFFKTIIASANSNQRERTSMSPASCPRSATSSNTAPRRPITRPRQARQPTAAWRSRP